MDLSIGPINLNPTDLLNLASEAAPIVGVFNPAIGIALASGSAAGQTAQGFLQKLAMDQTEALQDPEMRQRSARKDCRESRGNDCEVRDHRSERSDCERSRGCDDAGSGGGVFRELAYLLGKAMGKTAEELRAAAKQLGTTESGSKEFFQLNADVTALTQQLSFQSNNATNGIKTFGEAASNLVKK